MLTLITFIIVLGLLVFVHELGHFVAARKFGVKAEEFGFGFPPRLGGIYKNKEGKWRFVWGKRKVEDAADTVYSINWVPLGGFVKIKGEDGEMESDPDSFASKKIWKRAVILSAGVSMNVVLAMVLISIGFMIGLPQSLEDVDERAQISDKKIQIVQVLPNTPASEAGVQLGDIIVSINDQKFEKIDNLQQFVNENTGSQLQYELLTEGEVRTVSVVPVKMEETGSGGIGVAVSEIGVVKYSWYVSIWEGIKTTIILIWMILVAFYQFFKSLILGNGMSADVAGPVGIATLTGQAARMGFVYLLQFTALLSINLAIINFIPFPALDGGRVLFLLIEKIKGGPIKREYEAVAHNIGFLLLMLLVLVVTLKDVAKLGDNFKALWEKLF